MPHHIRKLRTSTLTVLLEYLCSKVLVQPLQFAAACSQLSRSDLPDLLSGINATSLQIPMVPAWAFPSPSPGLKLATPLDKRDLVTQGVCVVRAVTDNKYFILLFLLTFNISWTDVALAAPVQMGDVKAAAGNFLSRKSALSMIDPSSASVRSVSSIDNKPLFHIVDFGSKGWVLASSDDTVRPIIGWSEQPLPEEDIPPALQNWLQAEEAQIKGNKAEGGTVAALPEWSDLLAETAPEGKQRITTEADVDPLIEAHWRQGTPYNAACPADPQGPGGHALVGCVAVAMAQIMDYWDWPIQGRYLKDYQHDVYGLLFVDYAARFYDWASINPSGEPSKETQELLFDAGVAVEMNYGPSSSGATLNVSDALRWYFRYQNSIEDIRRLNYDESAWLSIIEEEIQARRPIVYSGTGAQGGHMFNVDGVRHINGLWFHINWGWGGTYDGWFTLNTLTPGGLDFSSGQSAVVRIVPEGVPLENIAPVVEDVTAATLTNTPVNIELIGFDGDRDPLTYRVNDQLIRGNILEWHPPLNQDGTFTFTYRACDARVCSEEGNITVDVMPEVVVLPTAVVPTSTPTALPTSTPFLKATPTPGSRDFGSITPGIKWFLSGRKISIHCSLKEAQSFEISIKTGSRTLRRSGNLNGRLSLRYRPGRSMKASCRGKISIAGTALKSKTRRLNLSAHKIAVARSRAE